MRYDFPLSLLYFNLLLIRLNCRAGEAADYHKEKTNGIQVREIYISFIQTGYNYLLKRGWYLPCHCHNPHNRRLHGSYSSWSAWQLPGVSVPEPTITRLTSPNKILCRHQKMLRTRFTYALPAKQTVESKQTFTIARANVNWSAKDIPG